MLIPVINVISISKDGRIISVRDATGKYDSLTNTGGYGIPNITKLDVAGVIFTLSHYSSPNVYSVRFVRNFDPEHPEYLTSPSVSNILDGIPVDITTLLLGVTKITEGVKSFNDGVLDLNYYVYTGEVAVTGVAGNPYVIGEDLENVYEHDSVLIGNTVYEIDHSKPTNGGTVLWLLKDLLADTVVLNPAYRANTKVLIDVGVNCCLQKNVAILAKKGCKCPNYKDSLDKLKLVLHTKIVADLDFADEDYDGANKCLEAASGLCKNINCNC